MKPSLISVLSIGCFMACAPASVPEMSSSLFTAAESTQALLRFSASVEIQDVRPQDLKKDEIRNQVEKQLTYMYGPMSAAQTFAAPRGDHRFNVLRVEAKRGAKRAVMINYEFEGTIAVRKSASDTYQFPLPVNPDTIYEAGIVHSSWGSDAHPCTDPHYETEDDFWYFWNPRQAGCPLREGVDYFIVQGKLKRIPNEARSYPNYPRLVDSSGNILISVVFGMDDPEHSTNPSRSGDLGAQTMRTIRKDLLNSGYASRPWEASEIRKLLKMPYARVLPYLEDFTLRTPKGAIVVRFFFGETGADENNRAFHQFLRESFLNASVLIYDGHSGLGANIDFYDMESAEDPVRFNQDRYQIYFFNSCSSYSYFNNDFFERKNSRNLDILTNGLSTDFAVAASADLALIHAVEKWATENVWMDYQTLARQMDSHNLFGVNGDEDNPKRAGAR